MTISLLSHAKQCLKRRLLKTYRRDVLWQTVQCRNGRRRQKKLLVANSWHDSGYSAQPSTVTTPSKDSRASKSVCVYFRNSNNNPNIRYVVGRRHHRLNETQTTSCSCCPCHHLHQLVRLIIKPDPNKHYTNRSSPSLRQTAWPRGDLCVSGSRCW